VFSRLVHPPQMLRLNRQCVHNSSRKTKRPSPLSQVMAFWEGLALICLHHPHPYIPSETPAPMALSLKGRRK
jgi:hypothetical protein